MDPCRLKGKIRNVMDDIVKAIVFGMILLKSLNCHHFLSAISLDKDIEIQVKS